MSDYIIPGWNDIVQDKHEAAREAFREWVFYGKPKFGPLFVSMKKTRASFKLSLRYCRQYEEHLRADACALHLQPNDPVTFLIEVNKISNSKAKTHVNCIESANCDK